MLANWNLNKNLKQTKTVKLPKVVSLYFRVPIPPRRRILIQMTQQQATLIAQEAVLQEAGSSQSNFFLSGKTRLGEQLRKIYSLVL